jgi:pilus assembly protein CpaC
VLSNLVLQELVPQILLQVRVAEVTRSALEELGASLLASDVAQPSGATVETLTEGLVRLVLAGDNGRLEATLDALSERGLFQSLAEPELLARNGEQASFLSGGEFPFPVIQGGGGADANSITIVWKEFGVRLTFVPRILPDGRIRLFVAPEVSSLDFANGLRVSGLQIPSLVTRRAETEVELAAGQHLAIAGLMDHSLRDNEGRIPVLGSIPLLGALFRRRDAREEQTELLVLVTPRLVVPEDVPPPVPGGEPDGWRWRLLPAPGGGRTGDATPTPPPPGGSR